MADFLNRLAARALGAIPLAEPTISTRFSAGTQPGAFLASEPVFQPARPDPDTSIETSADRLHSLHIREAAPGWESRVANPVPPFQDLDDAPSLTRSQSLRAFPLQPPPLPPYTEREIVQSSPERAEVWQQHLVGAMNPTNPEMLKEPASHRAQTASPATIPFATPQPAPRISPVAEPMSMPVLHHSERAETFNPLPPTVSVSIGRIEVRAEITSPSPTAPIQRRRPSTMSLDQFLKQVGGSAQ